MNQFSDKMQPADLIAMMIIIGCFGALLITAENPQITSLLGTVVGFYFGRASRK